MKKFYMTVAWVMLIASVMTATMLLTKGFSFWYQRPGIFVGAAIEVVFSAIAYHIVDRSWIKNVEMEKSKK